MVNSIKIIGKKIRSKLYVDYDRDYHNSVFLAGTGRSGTTWVSNAINYNNEYRYIFEPFHSYKVNICKKYKYRQYLRPENKCREYIQPATQILSGKIRGYWVDHLNNKFIADKRLIKDIRANLLLRWIYVNFSNIPIILLLRHPCAVACSKLKLNWDTHLEEYLSQEELIEDYLFPVKKEIEKAKSDFEKHIFLWCIENYVPLKQFNEGEIHLVFYENLCINPEREIKKLFSFLNKKYNDGAIDNINNPSSLSRSDSAIVTGESLIDMWRKYVSKEQIIKAEEILSIFGLDKIYSRETMPNVANAFKMLICNTQKNDLVKK